MNPITVSAANQNAESSFPNDDAFSAKIPNANSRLSNEDATTCGILARNVLVKTSFRTETNAGLWFDTAAASDDTYCCSVQVY